MTNHNLFISDLKINVRGDILTDKASLGMYATDASLYQIQPVVIVLPKDSADVQTAIKIAVDHQVSVLPRGGGTSLAGQTVGHSLVLDFSKYMNQVLELNAQEGWALVQPGLVRDELNAFLEAHNLHFAPDPATSSRANIGGMIGNNSSGTKSILYGKTVDHLLELKIVLADGTEMHLQDLSQEAFDNKAQQNDREGEIYRQFKQIILDNEAEIQKRFPKVMRRVQGYNLDEFAGKESWNLSKLICGSEGTLATILEAKIKLEPLPKFKSVCAVHFADFMKAIEAVNPMLPFRPSAIEIIDDIVIRMSRENLTTQRHTHFIQGNPKAIQIVEFYGDTEEEVLERPAQMVEELKKLGLGYAFPIFPEGPIYDDVWLIRKKGLGLMLGIKSAKKPLAFIEDASIPTDVLPQYIEQVLQVCKDNQTEAAAYAHASVGVIHVRPILDLRQSEDIERFKTISRETFKLVKAYGGSWSGEHGDGLVRSYFLRDYFGEQVYGALKEVKQLFDPNNLMNPGKIIDAQEIDQNLRYGTTYKDQAIDTIYKYNTDGSFENAVHMCTGVGECRKMLGGTMCPSFKATRDEEHSTRGRANALRLAMSGQLDEKGLTSKRLKETLDLCISCKACKSECPSNVDMAKLKGEVLQKHYDEYGIAFRDKLIRDSSLMASRLSGWLAPFVNLVNKNPITKLFLEKMAGFDRRRTLPAYSHQSFVNWFKRNHNPEKSDRPQVVLFADTYLNYHETSVGMAATRLLHACGFDVLVADAGCCQRPKLSHGFLKAAKADGTQVALNLKKYLQADQKIVVCEPSCASALTDDLPDLIDDEALAKKMQQNIQPLEIFLAKAITAGQVKVQLKSKAKHILLHGHCHQKALFGTSHLKLIFQQVPGVKLEELPSGCCGMAGSFGYEKEHYDISQKMGENGLFPPIREAPADAAVIASGFSCRHQIQDFTGRQARHWAEILEVEESGTEGNKV